MTHQLLDVWPIVSYLYSQCCFHIVNDGANLDVSTIKTPTLLSGGTLGKNYPSQMLHALISTTCVLTILSPSSSRYHEKKLRAIFAPNGSRRVLQKIRPQAYVIISEYDDQLSWFPSMLLSSIDLYHWPEVFVLRPEPDRDERNLYFKVKFFCWYCRNKSTNRTYGLPLDIFVSSCIPDKANCGKVLKNLFAADVFDSGAHYWYFDNIPGNPQVRPYLSLFGSQSHNATIREAVASFLYNQNESMLYPSHTSHSPYFGDAL